MKKTLFFFLGVLSFMSTTRSQTVTIGTQVWMTKNLDVDHFRNGDPIPQAKTDEEWKRAGENKQPAWCYYDNDPANGVKYGKLYNWYAVNDQRGLAPGGYHVPSDEEWTVLTDYLGGSDIAGKKMKSKSGWSDYTSGGSQTCPNCKNWNAEYRSKVPCHTCKDTRSVPAPEVKHSGNGTNSSGFTGFPGGFRNRYGSFFSIGEEGEWWSSSEYLYYSAWNHYLKYVDGNMSRYPHNLGSGLSVRCLRD
jgi:uncharacterized protein (TIGR02145 family)